MTIWETFLITYLGNVFDQGFQVLAFYVLLENVTEKAVVDENSGFFFRVLFETFFFSFFFLPR